MYLTGSKRFNLDAKARLTLPSEFRKELGETVCLIPLDNAVYGFTPDGHRAWVESFFPNGFNPHSRNDDNLRRQLNERTVTVDLDSAGRVALGKIDEKYRTHLGLEREVQVIGNGDHFEVWNAGKWEESQADFDGTLESLMYGE